MTQQDLFHDTSVTRCTTRQPENGRCGEPAVLVMVDDPDEARCLDCHLNDLLAAAEIEDAPEQGGGDCYAVAGRTAIDGFAAEDLRVVHGTVESKTVPRHGHAWIEYTDPQWGRLVLDRSNGNDVTLPWDFYYELGRVRDTAYYTREEALTKMLSTGHFGPWHDDGVSR